MADAKYGRLFTEQDVRLLMRFAHIDGWRQATGGGVPAESGAEWSPDDALRRYEECDNPLTFPADEPLFLLRGQDEAAPAAIAPVKALMHARCGHYYFTALAAGADDSHLDAIAGAAAAMCEWQAAHPDRVKVPD